MEHLVFGKIKKEEARHAAEVSKQTGFPSPATHYLEPSIDLNKELTGTKDATFYVRIASNSWSNFLIKNNDVLIIDRALTPKRGNLVLAVQDGVFQIIRINSKTPTSSFVLWGVVTYIIQCTT